MFLTSLLRSANRRLCAVLLLTLLASGCAVQRIRSTSSEQLAAGQYEAAVKTLEEGFKQYPDSTELRTALLQSRAEALTRLLTEAGAARAQNKFEAADALLHRAQALDPSNVRVRELAQALEAERRQTTALANAQALAAKGQAAAALRVIGEGLKDNPRHPELLALQHRLESVQRQAQLQSARGLSEARPISLDFRDASLRTVLDLVSRNSGINFVLDKDIRSDLRVTILLRNARVEDALDLIIGTHQLSKKVLDDRTILIYPNTPEKQREHQEQVIRVFYLASAEAKGAAAFLKAMLKVKEPFVDERSNMLALREAPEVAQLAERLIALYDASEPEVMLELEVLEVGSNSLTELGIKFPDTIGLTPLPPAGSNTLTVSNLNRLGFDRVGVSISGLLLSMRREVGDFEVLANPRVRAKSKEKAKILIGNKVPVITTTSSQSGFVSDNVNYLDVGLKLELEPTVYADDDVSIKVGLEVSSLAGQVKTSTGLLAYQVETRNASTVLRLRDGETQVLAGLISREQRSSANRVPGAGDIPVLGRLFSSQLDNGQRSELVLAITPRVLRNLRRPDATETEMWVGTESYTRLRGVGGRVPENVDAPAAEVKPTGLVVAPPKPLAAADAASASSVAPAPAAAASAAEPTPPVPVPVQPLSLRLSGPNRVKVGQEFSVDATLSASVPVRGVNLRVAADRQMASLQDATGGSFFRQDGGNGGVSRSDAGGAIQVNVLRAQATGLAGDGVAASLRFKALKPGRLELSIVQADAVTVSPNAPKAVTGPPLVIEITP